MSHCHIHNILFIYKTYLHVSFSVPLLPKPYVTGMPGQKKFNIIVSYQADSSVSYSKAQEKYQGS